MAWTDTYKTIAEEIDATFTDRPNGLAHVENAMKAIVDLESGDELGEEATIGLLYKFYKLHKAVFHQWAIDEERKLLVYQVNWFTERHKGDLTTFVNSIPWDNGCVPYYWGETSTSSLYDTSGWPICS